MLGPGLDGLGLGLEGLGLGLEGLGFVNITAYSQSEALCA